MIFREAETHKVSIETSSKAVGPKTCEIQMDIYAILVDYPVFL